MSQLTRQNLRSVSLQIYCKFPFTSFVMWTWACICYQCRHHHHHGFKSVPGRCRVSYTDFTHTGGVDRNLKLADIFHIKPNWITGLDHVLLLQILLQDFCQTCVSTVLHVRWHFVAVFHLIWYWYLFIKELLLCCRSFTHTDMQWFTKSVSIPPLPRIYLVSDTPSFTSVKTCNEWVIS